MASGTATQVSSVPVTETSCGEQLAETVRPMLGYVYRLARRMQHMGWHPDDPLYVAAWESYYALHALHVHSRYATCHPGRRGSPSAPP